MKMYIVLTAATFTWQHSHVTRKETLSDLDRIIDWKFLDKYFLIKRAVPVFVSYS